MPYIATNKRFSVLLKKYIFCYYLNQSQYQINSSVGFAVEAAFLVFRNSCFHVPIINLNYHSRDKKCEITLIIGYFNEDDARQAFIPSSSSTPSITLSLCFITWWTSPIDQNPTPAAPIKVTRGEHHPSISGSYSKVLHMIFADVFSCSMAKSESLAVTTILPSFTMSILWITVWKPVAISTT